MYDYDDEDRSISEVIANRASIDIQTMIENMLPAETQILEKSVRTLGGQLRRAEKLDEERCAEIAKLEACIAENHTQYMIEYEAVERLYNERNVALIEVKNLEKQISEFLYTDYSDYSRLREDTSKEITDLHARIEKLQIRLANCAH